MVDGEISAAGGWANVEHADSVVAADGDVMSRAGNRDGLIDDLQLAGKRDGVIVVEVDGISRTCVCDGLTQGAWAAIGIGGDGDGRGRSHRGRWKAG